MDMEVGGIFVEFPEFETERLKIRKINRMDLQNMFEYCSDPDVAKYTSWGAHQRMEDTAAYINYIVSKYELKQIAPWGIEHKDSGELIGSCEYITWSPTQSKAGLGYVLSKRYWGHGYITEAVARIIEFGFTAMGLVRIEALCIPDNIGSYRVMEKLGMTFEGILRKYVYVKGEPKDVKMYSILKTDYEGKHKMRSVSK